jgi:hypothetical protein
MDGPKSVVAYFGGLIVITSFVNVNKNGTGSGTVTSPSPYINCGNTCSATYFTLGPVVLTATAHPGSRFAGWSGSGCSGIGTCTVYGTSTVTATFNVEPGVARLANISTRGQVQSGFDVMIGGFVVNGDAPKTIVVRAIGPSLANYGVSGALANPTLQLVRNSDNTPVATNDDWQAGPDAAIISALGLAPSHPSESALLVEIPAGPGGYTAIVSGVAGATGVGLVEVYEVDHAEIPIINLSTRGKVSTGFDVMIGGFVVLGGPQTVVVRAIGPSLASYGVAGALGNPSMQLIRLSDNAVIATNDDWTGASNAPQISASGFAPSNPLESAILVTLEPGAYTAVVSGVGGTSGVGLVEVYRVSP